jgi:hypothetical protein
MTENQLPSEEEQIKAVELGQRLAVLIDALKITEEEKDALVGLLPEMTGEQLEKLTALLETNFLNQNSAAADKEFADGLRTAQEEYEASMQTATARAVEQIKEIEEKL